MGNTLLFLMLGLCTLAQAHLELSSYEEAQFWAFKADCMEEHAWTDEDLLGMLLENGPNNADLECLLGCIYVKSGVMDLEGTLDFDNLTEAVGCGYSREDISDVYKSCPRSTGENLCDWAGRVHYCYFGRWSVIGEHIEVPAEEKPEETDVIKLPFDEIKMPKRKKYHRILSPKTGWFLDVQ